MSSKRDGLTNKQQKFCEELVCNGYNQTQAYLAAYDTQNVEVARVQGHRLLKNKKVIDYVKRLQEEQFKRACITPERVAMKLAEIAFAEKGDKYYNSSAQLKALDLIQKQYGWQQQVMKVEETKINLVIDGEEDKGD